MCSRSILINNKIAISDVLNEIYDRLSLNDASFTSILLPNKNLGDDELLSICVKLIYNQTVIKWNIRGNRLTDTSATSISRLLYQNNRLCYLHLGNNLIADKGAIQLAVSLKYNRTLSRLYLYGNQIGILGAQALAVILEKDNNTLEIFNLSSNKIDIEGTLAFVPVIRKNKKLLELSLQYECMNQTTQLKIREALVDNNTLSYLCVSFQRGNEVQKELDDKTEMNLRQSFHLLEYLKK